MIVGDFVYSKLFVGFNYEFDYVFLASKTYKKLYSLAIGKGTVHKSVIYALFE